MTDAEIIKALEICNSLHLRCGNGCPYYEAPYKDGKRCSEMMIDDTLALINRQKAEIERLQKDGLVLNKTFMDFVNQQKAEAIKEFAERLKIELFKRALESANPNTCPNDLDSVEVGDTIDNLVKEMTEQPVNYESRKMTE